MVATAMIHMICFFVLMRKLELGKGIKLAATKVEEEIA